MAIARRSAAVRPGHKLDVQTSPWASPDRPINAQCWVSPHLAAMGTSTSAAYEHLVMRTASLISKAFLVAANRSGRSRNFLVVCAQQRLAGCSYSPTRGLTQWSATGRCEHAAAAACSSILQQQQGATRNSMLLQPDTWQAVLGAGVQLRLDWSGSTVTSGEQMQQLQLLQQQQHAAAACSSSMQQQRQRQQHAAAACGSRSSKPQHAAACRRSNSSSMQSCCGSSMQVTRSNSRSSSSTRQQHAAAAVARADCPLCCRAAAPRLGGQRCNNWCAAAAVIACGSNMQQ